MNNETSFESNLKLKSTRVSLVGSIYLGFVEREVESGQCKIFKLSYFESWS